MDKIPDYVLGNGRLPERRLLLYNYDEVYNRLLFRFMSNKTWQNKPHKFVELRFGGVANYVCHFTSPKIEPWQSLDENNYRESDGQLLIHLNEIKIDFSKMACRISFHDSFGWREFAFAEFEYLESKASKAD